MHALASHLGCTVAAIERGMSAREFAGWMAWMEAERIGPTWDRLRHAELLAAAYNGASSRADGSKRPWAAADFLPPDPWAAATHAPVAADPEAHAAALARELQAMEHLFS